MRRVWVSSLLAMSEKAPLLHCRLTSGPGPEPTDVPPPLRRTQEDKHARKLAALVGVVIPTLLSMFSVVVFLRVGEWRIHTKKTRVFTPPPLKMSVVF